MEEPLEYKALGAVGQKHGVRTHTNMQFEINPNLFGGA